MVDFVEKAKVGGQKPQHGVALCRWALLPLKFELLCFCNHGVAVLPLTLQFPTVTQPKIAQNHNTGWRFRSTTKERGYSKRLLLHAQRKLPRTPQPQRKCQRHLSNRVFAHAFWCGVCYLRSNGCSLRLQVLPHGENRLPKVESELARMLWHVAQDRLCRNRRHEPFAHE